MVPHVEEGYLRVTLSEGHKEGVEHVDKLRDVVQIGNLNVLHGTLGGVPSGIVKLEQFSAPIRKLYGLDEKVHVHEYL